MQHVTRFRGASLCAAALLTLHAACASDGGSDPLPPAVTVAMAPNSGNGQQGPVAQPLANPIRVLVTRNGAPEPGATVTWAATGTGASMSPPSGTTDAQGLAATTWTLPQQSGARNATASVAGAGGSPVTFVATAQPGPATQLLGPGGNGQSGEINTALANPIQVTAADQFGNGVANISVAWQVTSGGGSVAPLNSTTSALGTASTVWTLGGTLGVQEAEGAVAGLANSPVAFSATGTPPPPVTEPVSVGNNFYSPATVTITAGTQVRWTWVNTGVIPHSVSSVGMPSFPSSLTLTGNGSTYSFVFTTPGVYNYDCAVHGALMAGTVTVNP